MKKFFKTKRQKDDSASVLTVRTKKTKILFGVVFAVFTLYAISLIYPFVILFVNSLKDGLEYIQDLNDKNILGFADKPLFDNYVQALSSMSMVNSLGAPVYMYEMFVYSIFYALFVSVCAAVSSTLTAYAISKYTFKLRSVLFGMTIVTMTIPVIGNTGSMLKLLNNLGIYNTWLYVILVNFGGFGFNFLVLYGFFNNVSWSYAEAAMIDGANHFQVFLKVILPQALPVLSTLVIVAFIGAWNDYQTPLLYMPDFPTLSSGLYRVEKSITRGGNYPIYFAGILISVAPIIILFVCFFDTIMKNYSVGGLKG